jgi:hypothetical protein
VSHEEFDFYMTNPQSEEKNTTEAQSKELNPSSNNEDFVPTVVHFSCKNCNIHISDTMWYYRSTPKILALDAACHIKYDDKLHFVPDGEDQGRYKYHRPKIPSVQY